MTANLSIIRASRGMCSQISRPGTLVGIGLIFAPDPGGGVGLQSNMSWCGGPPARKTMMTALCERLIPVVLGPKQLGKREPPQGQPADLQEIAPGHPVAKPVRARPAIVNIRSPLSASCDTERSW